MRVDDEVRPGDDEPGCLALNEDNSVGAVVLEPVVDVGYELPWHQPSSHFVGMDNPHSDNRTSRPCYA